MDKNFMIVKYCNVLFYNVFSGILKLVSKLYVQHPPCGSNVNQKSKAETQKAINPCAALIRAYASISRSTLFSIISICSSSLHSSLKTKPSSRRGLEVVLRTAPRCGVKATNLISCHEILSSATYFCGCIPHVRHKGLYFPLAPW